MAGVADCVTPLSGGTSAVPFGIAAGWRGVVAAI